MSASRERGRTTQRPTVEQERLHSAQRHRDRFLAMWSMIKTMQTSLGAQSQSGSGIDVQTPAATIETQPDSLVAAAHHAELPYEEDDELYRLTPGLGVSKQGVSTWTDSVPLDNDDLTLEDQDVAINSDKEPPAPSVHITTAEDTSGAPMEHLEVATPAFEPQPILIPSIDVPRHNRKMLFFLVEATNEDLAAYATNGGQISADVHRQVRARSLMAVEKHNERVFSIRFQTVRKSRAAEGMKIWLCGREANAERLLMNRTPHSFFWTVGESGVKEKNMIMAVEIASLRAKWKFQLYRQKSNVVEQYVMYFEQSPDLLRFAVPVHTTAGKIVWAWFEPKVPRSDCLVCSRFHEARCLRFARQVL